MLHRAGVVRCTGPLLRRGSHAENAAASETQFLCAASRVTSATRLLAPEVLAAMTRSLAHRGPDADGFSRPAAHTSVIAAVSVIDIAGSPQPMTSPDGRVAVIFNGEIYNYRQLREELARGGWTFRSAGDTGNLAGRMGGMGRGRRHAFARHVRLRVVGREYADAVRGARPSGRQAVSLRMGWRDARLRLRAQGGARAPRRGARNRSRARCGSISNASSFPHRIRCSAASASCRRAIR